MVTGQRVVCLDRRKNVTIDEAGVWEKFGVAPESIPDYLGLVGDSADGIPGIPRWGAKTAARVLARYTHLEAIPSDLADWQVELRGAAAIAASLEEHREDAVLYRELATLRLDAPLEESLEQMEWQGVRRKDFEELCAELGINEPMVHANEWRAGT